MPRKEGPLGPGPDALLELAGQLRLLRARAGSPTYRVLATRAHCSAAALSEAAGGRRMPSLGVTLAFVAACHGDRGEWEARWHDTAAALNGTAEPEPPAEPDTAMPYVGLRAFQLADADRFHGRDRVVEHLLDQVRAKRFVGVFGPSGSGKSSVLRAGLAARLTGSPVVVFTPGPHPFQECAVHLADLLGADPASLRAELAGGADHLHLRIRQLMVHRGGDLVLVVDQFEELFTLCADPDERARFIEALVTAARAADSRVRVVLAVRADFLGHCAGDHRLVAALREAQVLIGPMSADELRLAVTKPAETAGCRVETALVAALVADATGRPGTLPLISHALAETWRRRKGTTLTLAGYDAVGGVQHAIARTAEQAYARLDPAAREVAKQVFLRLTALGEGTEDTRRRLAPAEVDPDAAAVLETLAAARLVSLDRDGAEIAHEALIRHWPRLRDWLAEDRDGHRVHRALTEAAAGWHDLDEDPGALYRGTRLDLAREWAVGAASALSERERRFLDASLAARDAESAAVRRRGRRLRQLVALLAVLLLVAISTTVYATYAQITATRQRNSALAEKAVREAAELRTTDPALSVQLVLAAYRLDPTPSTRTVLLSLLGIPYSTPVPTEHTIVTSFALNRDGTVLVTAGPDFDTTVVWDVRDKQQPRRLAGLYEPMMSVAFNADGTMLAGSGPDGDTLWDMRDPRRPVRLAMVPPAGGDHPIVGDGNGVRIVTSTAGFSADGKLVAFTRGQLRTRVWGIEDPAHPELMSTLDVGDTSRVDEDSRDWSLFDPVRPVLATALPDGRVRLWDLTRPRSPHPLTFIDGHAGPLYALAFAPDGRVLATAGEDHVGRLWDVSEPSNPRPLGTLSGYSGAVRDIAFARDGRTVVTGGDERTSLLWDVSDPRAPRHYAVLGGHSDAVTEVALDVDGRTVVTLEGATSVRLVDAGQLSLENQGESAYTLTFADNGASLVTGAGDHVTGVWDITDMWAPRPRTDRGTALGIGVTPAGHTLATGSGAAQVALGDVHCEDPAMLFPPRETGPVMLTPDGRTMLSGNCLLDVTDPGHPVKVTTFPGLVQYAVFSTDGRYLAYYAVDRNATLVWDLTRVRDPTPAFTVPGEAFALALGADGLLAISGRDSVTRLRRITQPGAPEIAALPAERDERGDPPRLRLDQNGTLLVTSGDGRSPRLWDLRDPAHPIEIGSLVGHSSAIGDMALSHDGRMLATTSADSVRLWDLDVDRLFGRLCGLAYPRLTSEQWREYFADLEFVAPCS